VGLCTFCSCVHARDSNYNISPMSSRNCMLIPKVPSPVNKLKICSCILHSWLVQRSECLLHPVSDRNYVRLSTMSPHTLKFSFDQQKTAANQTVKIICVQSGCHSCMLLSVLRQVHSYFQSEFSTECDLSASSFSFQYPLFSLRSSNSRPLPYFSTLSHKLYDFWEKM
jgi:hypothetical protein